MPIAGYNIRPIIVLAILLGSLLPGGCSAGEGVVSGPGESGEPAVALEFTQVSNRCEQGDDLDAELILKNDSAAPFVVRRWCMPDDENNATVYLRRIGTSAWRGCESAVMQGTAPEHVVWTLDSGDKQAFYITVIADQPPGDYEMFAQLTEGPTVKTPTVKFKILPRTSLPVVRSKAAS